MDAMHDAVRFGLGSESVAAVVRRAALLTPGEIEALAAAWSAARWLGWPQPDWDAARDAVIRCVDYPAQMAIGAAVWDATKGAGFNARSASWGAAMAAAAADFAGECGLTQNHIDTLEGPWLQVIGRNTKEGETS